MEKGFCSKLRALVNSKTAALESVKGYKTLLQISNTCLVKLYIK